MEEFTITDRLKVLMGNISQREFARKLDISPSTLWEYLKGRVPPADFIVRICELFHISERWMLTGKGEMHRLPGESDSVTQQIMFLLQNMTEEQKNEVLRHVQKEKLLEELLEEREEKRKQRVKFILLEGQKTELTGELLVQMRQKHDQSLAKIAQNIQALPEQLEKFELGIPVLTSTQLEKLAHLVQDWEQSFSTKPIPIQSLP